MTDDLNALGDLLTSRETQLFVYPQRCGLLTVSLCPISSSRSGRAVRWKCSAVSLVAGLAAALEELRKPAP